MTEVQDSRSGARGAAGRWRTALRAMRSDQWRHFVVLPAAGQGAALLDEPISAGPDLFHGALLAAGCLGWAYGLNAITDRHDDRSEGKNPLIAAPPGRELMWLLGGCLLATALLAAWIGGWTATAATVSLLAGTVYSAGPRFKARPLLGTLVNGLIFAPLPLLGAPMGALIWPPLALLVAVFIALLCHNQLLHELADAEEDGAAGIRTTAAALGPAACTAVAALLAGLALMLTADHQPALLLALAICIQVASVLQVARSRSTPAALLRRQHRQLSLFGGAALWATALASGGL